MSTYQWTTGHLDVAGQKTLPLTKKLHSAKFTRDQLIARAESALENMREEFAGWMEEEVELLSVAVAEWEKSPNDPECVGELFRRAHDLKGQAPTLGFPVVGRIAASLCQLLSINGLDLREMSGLTRNHTNAIKAAVRDEVRDEKDNIASALAIELETAVAQVEGSED